VVLLNDSQEVVVALVWLLGSRIVLVVLLAFSRLCLQGAWELLSALL
jgi:hypothetical protein